MQDLSATDFERRESFIFQFLVALNDDPNLYSHILWTDESHFVSHGKPNRKNTHHWSDENPHKIRPVQRQGHFGINVWCGLIGRHLIGPYFYEGTLTGQRYLDFLQNKLPELLEDVPLQVRRNMWFQLDGAPCHTARPVQNYLNIHFEDRWIGIGGTLTFPPRSPDLTPLDFFLWGTLKQEVYKTKSNNIDHLREKILNACNIIRNADVIKKVTKKEIRQRFNLCLDHNGGYIEQFLK